MLSFTVNKSRVAVVRCDSYDQISVCRAVSDGIHLLGGVSRFAAPNEQILLKPNVLAGDDPEKLISPHPTVMRAVAEMFRKRNARLTYGDSPGFGKPEAGLRKAGLAAAAEEYGARMANFTDGPEMSYPDSPFTRRFFLPKELLPVTGW